MYYLHEPIVVKAKEFVVLGLGYPTLVPTTGTEALVVTGADVRVAAVLLEAGTSLNTTSSPTAPLLRWSGDDGVASDIFARVGAFNHTGPSKLACARTRADVHMLVEGANLLLDNTWLWHADHDDCGGLSDQSRSDHGLVVTGKGAIAYSLKVEHTFDDLTLWKGEGGAVYMYQSELPYHHASFASVGYRVAPHVTTHQAVGIGVYLIGQPYKVPTGVRLPPTADVQHVFVWAIAEAHEMFGSVVCAGARDDRNATCYQGDTCDWSSCYQLALPRPTVEEA